jgi:hypothetical protein
METKKCSMCEKQLPKTVEFFATRTDRKKLVFQSNCRECQKNYRREHYLKNKKKYIDKAAQYTKNIIEWFHNIKKELKCEMCGESRFWVLDFHHKDPKEKDLEVSLLTRKGSKKRIVKEIEKCSVLCANCHRDLHFKEKNADFA